METHRTSKMCLCLVYKALLQAKKRLSMWEEMNSKEESGNLKLRHPRCVGYNKMVQDSRVKTQLIR